MLVAATTGVSLGLSALVALFVSATISGLVKFVFDDTLANRKAARDYRYERRKELHALVGNFDGRLLETATDLYARLRKVTGEADLSWLDPKEDGSLGYFLSTTVYRFFALMRLAIAFDREAIYFDPEIASGHDLRCIRYAKSFQEAMAEVSFFKGTGYDVNEPIDHFFRDDLRTICTLSLSPREPLTYADFCKTTISQGRTPEVTNFFSSLSPEKTPLRWDRLIALQLLLAAFINSTGYANSKKDQAEFDDIAKHLQSPRIRANLLEWFPKKIRDVDKDSTAKIVAAIARTGKVAPKLSGSVEEAASRAQAPGSNARRAKAVVQVLEIESAGRKLVGRTFSPAGPRTGPSILFVHGLESSQRSYGPRAEAATEKLGATCLTFDLSGHGESDGPLASIAPREHLADVLAAFDTLLDLDGVDPSRIGICGASYGGYLAALAISERKVKGLLLRAPALLPDSELDLKGAPRRSDTETPDTAAPLRNLADFPGPVLVVESEHDEQIPHEIIAAYLSASPTATHATIPGAAHALRDPGWNQAFIDLILGWGSTSL